MGRAGCYILLQVLLLKDNKKTNKGARYLWKQYKKPNNESVFIITEEFLQYICL